MKLYEGIASAIADEADGPVFGLMGNGNMYIWAAMVKQGRTTIYSARNEAGAVAMADGYFRGTGRLGIATLTCGPGLTQIGTSLMAAARNRTPMVVVAGEIPLGSKNKGQWMDQRRFAEACSTRYCPVTGVDNAADEIAEAFFAARANRCPVLLSIPEDIQEHGFDWDWEYRPSRDFVPFQQEAATEEALEPLVEALARAERPIIVAGRGARLGNARGDIVRVADQVGALLATSLQAKGLFEGHEYDIGLSGTFASAPGEELFAEADFVLGIGAELGYHTGEGGLLFPNAQVARIDIAPAPRDLGILPGLYVRGDAARTAARLSLMLEQRQIRRRGYRTESTRRVMASSDYSYEQATDGLDPRTLMRQLSKAIPEGAIITSGVGHFFGFIAMHLAIPASVDIQFSVQFVAVGQTLPNAIGIGVGNPGRKHLVIEGDGSLMMNVQELETAARHNIPMVLLVMNDAAYGAEVHKLALKGFDPDAARWRSPDFVGLARAFGGDGVLIESEDEIGEAMARGFAAGGLFLIDARISPTTVTDAYKKVHFGIPNTTPLLRYGSKGM